MPAVLSSRVTFTRANFLAAEAGKVTSDSLNPETSGV